MAASDGGVVRRYLLAILLIAFFARAVPAFVTRGAVAPDPHPRYIGMIRGSRSGFVPAYPGDIGLFYRAAALIHRGENPYERDPHYSTYPPLWMGFSYAAFRYSRTYGIPYDLFFKGMDLLADLGTTALIFLAAIAAGLAARKAALLALFFALNPFSILITSLHGANDPVILFLIVLALHLQGRGKGRWAYFALGVGVAIKIYPVLLAPLFLIHDLRIKRLRPGVLVFIVLPFLITLIPYYDRLPLVFRQVASYGGVSDFGYLSVVRTWMIIHEYRLRFAPRLFTEELGGAKVAFLIAYALILIRFWGSRIPERKPRYSLERATLIVFLHFLAIYGGISAQYLVWVIPLALLPGSGGERRWLLGYTAMATMAILLFYWIFHPGMYYGYWRPASRITGGILWTHLLVNLFFWGVTVAWALRVTLSRSLGQQAGPERAGTSASTP